VVVVVVVLGGVGRGVVLLVVGVVLVVVVGMVGANGEDGEVTGAGRVTGFFPRDADAAIATGAPLRCRRRRTAPPRRRAFR
jgi:hypothetical protein